jgi:Transposase DDE domain group 1
LLKDPRAELRRITLKVQRDGRDLKVVVTSDGAGLVSHAGSALLGQVANKVGLTRALSTRLAGIKKRQRGHDPGRVVRDLAVMLADGGDAVCDLGGSRDQEALFGAVASDSTAFRMIDKIANDPALLEGVRAAHAKARERVWKLVGAPQELTIDIDATLITAHSEKQRASGNYKGGFGFHPLLAYGDQNREAMAGVLRPGRAGSNTAADQIAVAARALEQIPAGQAETIKLLLRADSAGAVHELIDWCREGDIRYSVGYELTDAVCQAILQIPENTWIPAITREGWTRGNGEVAELTGQVDLSAWPVGSRLIVRRERAHPGAQLSFTDHDGHRFQVVLTDQQDPDIQVVECRHRQRAHVEDDIRIDKDTGLRKFPFHDYALNEVWLELVLIAHNLIVWTQTLLLTGDLARAEPKRLRYRLLHVAARLALHARQARLRLQATWPWAAALAAAFAKLEAIADPPG